MKNILCIALLLFTKITFAQFKSGITAGVNIANQKPAYSGVYNGQYQNINGESIVNFNAGILADFDINKKIKIRSQILYSGQGFKEAGMHDANGSIIVHPATIKLNYINIPVQVLYSQPVTFGEIFIGTGPYAGILLGGTEDVNGVSKKIRIGNAKTDELKRLDLGLHNSIGIEFKNGLFIGSIYQLGLIRATPNGGINKNYVLSFFIGYVKH